MRVIGIEKLGKRVQSRWQKVFGTTVGWRPFLINRIERSLDLWTFAHSVFLNTDDMQMTLTKAHCFLNIYIAMSVSSLNMRHKNTPCV